MRMIKPFIARNLYYPLYQFIYKRDGALKFYKYHKKAQWNSLENNRQLQKDKLYKLVKYVALNIPYYKKIIHKNKISFSRKTILDDLGKFPILTKDIIKNEFSSIFKPIRGVKWYHNQSGGSTGEPLIFIQDSRYSAESSAMERIQMRWAGYNYGDRQIKLWGSEKDIYREKEKLKHRLANWMKSIYLLNSFLMGDKEIRAYIDIINKIKPKMILAYSQSIYELARYVESNRLQVYSPHSILSSATPLSSNNRNTIERVFNCQVYNRYGSREVGSIASECYKHEGLHVSILTHYIEILNDKLEMCKEGEKGEIYVTLLTNYTMPLIRYKIQDMAIFTNKPCSCGRGLPLIIDVMGRTSEYFLKRDGTKVDGYFFDFPIWDKNWLLRYQIIQKGYNLLVYNLKVQYEPPRGELEEIDNKIKKVMGNDCKIIFNFVDNIVPSVSGKYKQFIRDF